MSSHPLDAADGVQTLICSMHLQNLDNTLTMHETVPGPTVGRMALTLQSIYLSKQAMKVEFIVFGSLYSEGTVKVEFINSFASDIVMNQFICQMRLCGDMIPTQRAINRWIVHGTEQQQPITSDVGLGVVCGNQFNQPCLCIEDR